MHIIPYTPDLMKRLLLQPKQAAARRYLKSAEYLEALNVPGMAFAAEEDGVVFAAAGVLPLWQGRGEAWALLSGDLGGRFVGIHRAVMRFLEACPLRRIETAVDVDFHEAVRWAHLLDFKLEGVMAGYTPDGRDCYRYARVRR